MRLETAMFTRDHHQRIALILQELNPERLESHGCLFGGGTASEYRESADIDFMVSNLAGYRELRQLVRRDNSLASLWKSPSPPIQEKREPLTDQYGIHTRLSIKGVSVKFEIVLEGRISLDQPSLSDQVCGISCLTAGDMACSKLLANSDRWNDDSVFSRDIHDLAHLPLKRVVLAAAISKSEAAYGTSIRVDVNKAVDKLKRQPGWLERCQTMLCIESPRAVLWQKLKHLERLVASC
jgi:hypothetical protein